MWTMPLSKLPAKYMSGGSLNMHVTGMVFRGSPLRAPGRGPKSRQRVCLLIHTHPTTHHPHPAAACVMTRPPSHGALSLLQAAAPPRTFARSMRPPFGFNGVIKRRRREPFPSRCIALFVPVVFDPSKVAPLGSHPFPAAEPMATEPAWMRRNRLASCGT
jgi:hypothetical protein